MSYLTTHFFQRKSLIVFLAALLICGCSGNANNGETTDKSDTSNQSGSEAADINEIIKQVELSQNFNKETIVKFDAESQAMNRKFLVERSKQEILARHLNDGAEKLKVYVDHVNSGNRIQDGHSVLSNEERLEVAKLAQAILEGGNDDAIVKAQLAAVDQAKKIDSERNELSDSRYAEKKKLKAEKDASQAGADLQNAFKSLLKDKNPDELNGFSFDESIGSFSDTNAMFMFKDADGKRLRFGFSVNPEAARYVNEDKINTQGPFRVMAESPTQLVLETGRLMVRLKSERELGEGGLWDFYTTLTDKSEMSQLIERLK
jgi:hypothetical protein